MSEKFDFVCVRVYDVKSDELVFERVLQYNDDCRRWIMKTISWSINNGKIIEICHERDKNK